VKRLALGTVLALLATLCFGQLMAETWGSAGSDKTPQLRSLEGLVTNNGDTPLNDAIVYLKNTKTLAVKTFITEKDGGYRFNALSPNVDYEVYAEFQGKKSGTKTLSSFDSRTAARINLKIDVSK